MSSYGPGFDIGKFIELEIKASNEAEARMKVELLSDRLLANPVIENWSMDLKASDPIKTA